MSLIDATKRNEQERQAMEVAEEAREERWEHPSFCSQLYSGTFDFSLVYPFPDQSAADKAAGDAFVGKLISFLEKNIDPLEVDRTREIPPQVVQGLRELGAFGIKIPKEYGGLGMSQTNYGRAIGAVATICPSTAVLLSAHQSIGVPQPLKLFGTEEQKKKWLPRLAKGAISAFALTEREVGSDPARMGMTATPIDNGNAYLLTGEKLWTTNGPIADILVVMAVTPPLKLPNGREKKQITAFVVEKNMPGFSILHRCDFMGLKGIQNGVLRFQDVKVPKENILWGLGKGLKLALTTLNNGRLTLPAAATATGRACLVISRHWAKERSQWGQPIGLHEASASRVLFAAGATYAMEAVSSLSAGMADSGKTDIRIEASAAKLFSSGLGWRVIDQTLQLRGGRGYETAASLKARGEDGYPVEQILRDFRINTIIEGTSDIQRLFIAREALDRHLGLAMGLFNPKASIGQKLATLVKAAGSYALWYPRLWFPVLWPLYAWAGGWEGKALRFLARHSKRLARRAFHAMVVNGPGLEKKQRLLGRMVDSGMYCFALAAVMSRYLTRKKKGQLNAHERLLVKRIVDTLVRDARSTYRKMHIWPGKSALITISKAAMDGELTWLEADIGDIAGAARARF